MTMKKHHVHKARDDAALRKGEIPAPQQIEKQHGEITETQEDVLILLAQQIQARRQPSRYLDGWIRRFVRGG